ncbi:MAG: 50S ribosomal protein L29 [Thermoproteus sp. AZ2]|jgi:large subunit ribosomal protein L29|uniref:50S ribosomal protein L29 n=1 Tax=Thermoproteus sp. AZ2 TaxID=1609232 RepID=A0ACC6V257_9CREN|nr:MAG: 50S ribosomal protein L29 [Thermoproteus sp. AZ2]
MSSQPKKLNAKTLRQMSREERLKLLDQLRAEYVRLQTQRARGIIENSGRIRYIRRAIARILTIEREQSS